jgi:CHAD domain-containing protein
VKARAPSLTGKMRTDTAFRRIVDNDVGMMLANLALTLRGDVEGLHRMRVSLRQLRADFALFKPLLNERKTMVVSDRLRQLGRILGDARDWDVFSLETVPAVMDDTADRTGLGRLARVADTQRQASRKPVEEEIRAPEFTTLLLSLSAGLEDHHGAFLANHERLARPMDKVAPDLLDRALRKIRKRGKHIGRLKGPELHALRKSLKKLRYGVAALESLFGRKQVEVYLDECWALQKTLGNMNDANAAERLAQSLAENDQELRLPAGVIRKWAGRRRKKLQRKLDGAWSRLRGARPLWR